MPGGYLQRIQDEEAKAFLAQLEAKGAMPRGEMVFPGSGGFGTDGPGGYGIGGLLGLLNPNSDFDYAAQAGDFWRNSTTAACLRVYRANFPQPRYRVIRRDGKGKAVEVQGNRSVALMKRPNPYYDWAMLGGAVSLSAVVDGNVYLLIVRSAAGIPVELWWVPPWMIQPAWDAAGHDFITHYLYRVNGRTFEVPAADVIHYRHGGLDPRDTRRGMSEMKAAGARTVCSLNEVDGFTASILRNMGIPTVLISPATGTNFTQAQSDAVRQQWRERLTGEYRGSPLFPSGPITVTKLSFTPEEMALDKIPSRLEDQVCALTGVPSMMVGVTSGAVHKTYANYGEARRAFYEDTLTPFQSAFASCLTHQLLSQPGMGGDGSLEANFDYAEVPGLGEERDSLWNRVGKAYSTDKTIMRSEAREALGYEAAPEDQAYYDDLKRAVPAPGMDEDGSPVTPASGDDEDDSGEEPDGDEDKPAAKPKKPKGKMDAPFGGWPSVTMISSRGRPPTTSTGSLGARISARRSRG